MVDLLFPWLGLMYALKGLWARRIDFEISGYSVLLLFALIPAAYVFSCITRGAAVNPFVSLFVITACSRDVLGRMIRRANEVPGTNLVQLFD